MPPSHALVATTSRQYAVALSRAFITHFWATQDRTAPRMQILEGIPIALLLGGCIALAVAAEPALRYAQAAAADLHVPQGYVDAIMSARPRTVEAVR